MTDVARLPHKNLGRSLRSPLVSVVVPNYNHERFLKQRLKSIARQSFRNFEVIALDDASTDGSVRLLESFVEGRRHARLMRNDRNSGSTFKQWRKALSEAQGKYVWIAESDDYADRSLLARTVALLQDDPGLVVAHTHSQMIDLNGRPLGRPDGWLDDLSPGRWSADFTADGVDEIRNFLVRKNTIPNASAVVFRNFPGIELLVDDTMRLCADWLFWIRLLARGRYGFVASDLNFWRQNSSNARTRPPGVLEWEEGRRVLEEACAIAGLDAAQRRETVQEFRRRCSEWSGGAIDN